MGPSKRMGGLFPHCGIVFEYNWIPSAWNACKNFFEFSLSPTAFLEALVYLDPVIFGGRQLDIFSKIVWRGVKAAGGIEFSIGLI